MLRTILIPCLLLCLYTSVSAQTSPYWQRLNTPPGGDFTTLEPGQGDTCYAKAHPNRYYISPDGGEHWNILSITEIDSLDNDEERLFFSQNGGMYKILQYYDANNFLEYRLFKANSLGENWQLINNDIPDINVLFETSTGVLVGNALDSVFVSNDGGITWQSTAGYVEVAGLETIREWSNGALSVRGTLSHVNVSYNEGQTWTYVATPVTSRNFQLGPDNTYYVYDWYKFYRSDDQGITWMSLYNNIPTTVQINSMLVLQTGRLLLTTAAQGTWYSDDNGNTWNLLNITSPDKPGTLSFQLDNETILAIKSNANAIIRSESNATFWSLPESGPDASLVNNLLVWNDTVAFSYTPTGMWKSTNGMTNWQRITAAEDLVIPSGQDMFALWNPDTFLICNGNYQMLRTFDTGQTFDDVTPADTLERKFFYIHPQTDRVFTNTNAGIVYSDDFGDTWNTCLPGFSFRKIVRDATGRLYAFCRLSPPTYAGFIYRSVDNGATWSPINTLDPPPADIYGISVSPVDKLTLVVRVQQQLKLAISNDGGVNWIYRTIPEPSGYPFSGDKILVSNAYSHHFVATRLNTIWATVDDGLSWYKLPTTRDFDSYARLYLDDYGRLYNLNVFGGMHATQQPTLVGGYLRGHVFKDADADCSTPDAQEGLPNWKLTVEGSTGTTYINTGVDGSYQMFADTGTYTLRVQSPQDVWWQLCDSLQTAVIDSVLAVDTTDFIALPLADCPLMAVDVTAPMLRRCFNNTVSIQTCNVGTEPADSAWVDVYLDPFLSLVSSNQPHDSLGFNTWRFYVGTMASGDCAQFNFTVYVNCDSTVLGQTHCISAHAFPDTLCTEVPDWSGANLEARVSCQDTTVHFELENTGTAPSQPLDYIIIVDDVVLMQGQETYDIAELVSFEQPANGQTWRIESRQEPGHPFSTVALAFAEGCGGFGSLGFVNQFSLNGVTPSMDRFCLENTGSYDPNDKQGFPRGYGDDNRIAPGQDLEYLIRFQNTGTDTAFTVRIADTLSTWLDPASIVPGASSHPYSWSLSGEGIVTFLFENILLPDSNTNLAGSQGFVNFRIRQREQVPLNTMILNSAAIYFDFNTPVITNETRHTIGVDILNDAHVPAKPITAEVSVLVSPNPATDEATFRLRRGAFQGHRVLVTDAFGRVVHRGTANGDNYRWRVQGLPRGWYAWQVLDAKGKQVEAGKIILE